VLLAPLAVLLDLKTGLQGLLVLVAVVVHPFALGALQFDEIILGHSLCVKYWGSIREDP
jgi:hypothetical protein